MIDRIADVERQFAVGSIDRARRGVDEMLHAMVTAAFEHVQKAGDV
jgi:hypothetical protein